jgi:hypothetical protein
VLTGKSVYGLITGSDLSVELLAWSLHTGKLEWWVTVFPTQKNFIAPVVSTEGDMYLFA